MIPLYLRQFPVINQLSVSLITSCSRHEHFVLLCLRLLSTHLSLALAGGGAGGVIGSQARPLRNLLFRLMDMNTPQSVQVCSFLRNLRFSDTYYALSVVALQKKNISHAVTFCLQKIIKCLYGIFTGTNPSPPPPPPKKKKEKKKKKIKHKKKE